jgi:amidase
VAFELEEETISSVKIIFCKYTSEQLVQLYLDRIETIENGLELHSIIEVNSEAIAIAKTMDAEMKG